MSLVSEQLAKLNPNSGAAALRSRIQEEAAPPPDAAAPGPSPIEQAYEEQHAATSEQEARQAELEANHSQLNTVGTQLSRGLLDAVLAGGALTGLQAEGWGKLTGWQGLEQFGRDLGEASSGKSALSTGAEAIFGNPGAGLTTAERVKRDIDEQEKAWPMLSAASRMTGAAAPGLLTGGMGTADTLGMTVAAGGLEGASMGAQSGYENNKSFRDILTSSGLGALMGTGAAAAGEGLVSLINSKPLKAAARELVEDQNLSAAGLERGAIEKTFGAEAGAADQIATDLAGEISSYRFQSGPLEGKPLMRMLRTPGQIQEGIQQAAEETNRAAAAATTSILEEASASSPQNEQLIRRLLETKPSAEQLSDLAQQVLQITGKDPEAYQGLIKQADNFTKLTSLLEKAGSKEAGMLDNLPSGLGLMKLAMGASPIHAAATALLGKVAKTVIQQRSASTIATLANSIVLDNVSTALNRAIPAISTAATGAAGEAFKREPEPDTEKAEPPKTPEEKQERYQQQLNTISKAINEPDLEARMGILEKHTGDFGTGTTLAVGGDMQAKLMQLHADFPKPTPNLRGKAYETLSLQQVELANAMYEATTKPLSVFSDFKNGVVNYDKVSYAWKQYPGLKDAVQAGMMDILSVRLSESHRAAIPDSMLTQIDNLCGFDGSLQPTLDQGFAKRMDQLMQPPPNNPPPQSGGKLDSPLAMPTFTERLSGQRG